MSDLRTRAELEMARVMFLANGNKFVLLDEMDADIRDSWMDLAAAALDALIAFLKANAADVLPFNASARDLLAILESE